jgi:hypothetical protein
MATAAELEKDFENVKNRGDASHVHGLAKNVRDRIESVERSIDLLRGKCPTAHCSRQRTS